MADHDDESNDAPQEIPDPQTLSAAILPPKRWFRVRRSQVYDTNQDVQEGLLVEAHSVDIGPTGCAMFHELILFRAEDGYATASLMRRAFAPNTWTDIVEEVMPTTVPADKRNITH